MGASIVPLGALGASVEEGISTKGSSTTAASSTPKNAPTGGLGLGGGVCLVFRQLHRCHIISNTHN
jgi:hypothetical protein